MLLTGTPTWTPRRVVALALAVVVLFIPMVLTATTRAGDHEETDTRQAFAALRAQIHEDVPETHQRSLLAKVDAAEVALLLPAIQAAREASRSASAPVHILDALRQQNQVLSSRLGYDPQEIDRIAARLQASIIAMQTSRN
jgi:hypothetical protein